MQDDLSRLVVRVVLPYAAFAALWIYLSDRMLAAIVTDPALLTRLQTYKGLAFILATSALMYWLLRREYGRRAQAESEQQRLHGRLLDTLESMTDGFVALDKNWRYLYVNRRAAEMFARKPEDLVGRHIWTEFPEGVNQPFYKAYHQAMAEQAPITIEDYYAPWDRWFENRIFPSPDALYIFFQDITERKRSEQALRETNQLLDSIIEHIPDMIFVKDARTLRFVRFNQAGEALLGYSREDLIGKSDHDFFPKAQADSFTAKDYQVLKDGHLVDIAEEPLQTRHQGTRILHTKKIPLCNETGKPLYLLGISQDITEHRHTEERLRQWETVFQHAGWGVVLADPKDNRLLAVNPAFAAMHGYSVDEMLGMPLSDTLAPEERPRLIEYARTAEHAGHVAFESVRLRKDGSRFPALADVTLIRNEEGNALYRTANVQDISERKRAEDQLRDREQRLSALIRNLPGAVFRVRNDANYTTEYVSDQIADLTGYPADDFRENRRSFGELMHSDDREWVWNETQKALGEHRPYELTYRFIDAHGRKRWNWERGTGIYDANGELQAVEGFVQDITARKQTEAALREHEEVLRLFVELSPAAIGMFDNDMRYVAVSRRWLTDYGLDDRNLIGRSHYEIFPEIPQRWKDIHRRCLAGATERCDDDPFVRADGHTDWVKWEICPWRRADGGIGGIIVFSELVTARKQAERKLAENAERLERLSRQLLAAQETERRQVARELHDEIGQLLTVVKLDLQTVLRQPGTAALAPALKEGMESIDRVVARVRDLSLDLRPSMLDDLGLLPTLRWYVQRQMPRLGVAIDLALPPSLPRLASEIETACFRIVQEALTNAARHAAATHIEVTLATPDNIIELTVRDDGQGFDVAAARQSTLAGGGAGLLGMSERAELAGGQLTIVSAPGQGTTVRARFPQVEAQAPSA